MDDILFNFYQKNGFVIIILARDFFQIPIGTTIPTISEYCDKLNTGRGTIQNALNQLEESGCVSFAKHGHMGTVLSDRNRQKLWGMTGWNNLVVSCPFPGTAMINSMIGSVDLALKQAEIPYCLSYSIAVHNRLIALNEGQYSIAIATRLAYEASEGQYDNIICPLSMKGSIYGDRYSLVRMKTAKPVPFDGMRLAVSIKSAEQVFFAEELSKQYDVQVVYLNNKDSILALECGTVDGFITRKASFLSSIHSVFHRDASDLYDFTSLDFLGYTEKESEPVLLVNRQNYGMDKLVTQIFNPAALADTQQQILQGSLETSFF